jgi:hypothetical protein
MPRIVLGGAAQGEAGGVGMNQRVVSAEGVARVARSGMVHRVGGHSGGEMVAPVFLVDFHAPWGYTAKTAASHRPPGRR